MQVVFLASLKAFWSPQWLMDTVTSVNSLWDFLWREKRRLDLCLEILGWFPYLFSVCCSCSALMIDKTKSREGVTAVEEPVDCPNVSEISCKYALMFQDFLQSSSLPVWNRVDNCGFWRQFTVWSLKAFQLFQWVLICSFPVGILYTLFELF